MGRYSSNEEDEAAINTIRLLSDFGEINSSHGQYDDAKENFENALEISRNVGDRGEEMRLLANLGSVCQQLQQYDAAVKYYKAAFVISREVDDKRHEMHYLTNLGRVYRITQQLDNAMETYETVLQIAQEVSNRGLEGESCHSLGFFNLELGQYDRAMEYYKAALVITQELGARLLEGNIHSGIGYVHEHLGQYSDAMEPYKVALKISRETGNKEGELNNLNSIGTVYNQLKQHDEAIKYFEAAREISRQIGDRSYERQLFDQIAQIQDKLNRYHDAMESFRGALRISRELGDRAGEGDTLLNIGSVFKNLEKYNEAMENYEAALEISSEIGDKKRESSCNIYRGHIYSDLGQYGKAMEMYDAALEMSHEIGDRGGESSCRSNLGHVYFRLGQYSGAMDMYEAALKISREDGYKEFEGKQVGFIANVFWQFKDYDAAKENYEAALKIAREIGGEEGQLLNNIGNVSYMLGKYADAKESYIAALQISREISGNRQDEAKHIYGIGNVHLILKQHENAKENYEAALKISCEISDSLGEGMCLFKLGDVCFELAQHDDAKKYYNEALNVYDSIWEDLNDDYDRVTFDDTSLLSSSLKRLQELYLANGNHHLALECSEKARSRALKLLLNKKKSQNDVDSNEDLDFEAMRRIAIQHKSAILMYSLDGDNGIRVWVVKSNSSADLLTVVRSIEEKYKSLFHLVELIRRLIGAPLRGRSIKTGDNNDLSVTSASLGRQTDSTKGEMSEEDKHFDDDLYWIGAQLANLTVDGNREKTLSHLKDNYVDKRDCKQTDFHVSLVYEKRKQMIDSALKYMYQLLIAPIDDALKGEDRLVIVPCGELFALPFMALLDGCDDKDHTKRPQYLIEKFVLSFAPSIGTISGLKHRSDERDNMNQFDTSLVATIVGNPEYHGKESQLEYTEEEAHALAKIMDEDANSTQTHLFIGKDATVSNVMGAMDISNLIHIAAYGFGHGIRLSRSGDDEDNVGFDDMTMVDLQHNCNLEYSKLVVLSCCDTFRGETRQDGLIGITRSFIVAGTSTVVASLWMIDDASTLYMMKDFYKEMFRCTPGVAKDGRKVVDVSSAMQRTVKQMIAKGTFDIIQWAPMVVYGLDSFSIH